MIRKIRMLAAIPIASPIIFKMEKDFLFQIERKADL
jgi:hypothetical protein